MIVAGLAAAALANGQTSHVRITLHARDHLPPGELRELVMRDDLQPMLINGAMFPDGGYAVGDPYGEIAHWEPLQEPYLRWIHDTYDAPWPDEAARHVAFLLGLASHGMADQVFDSLYMERARVHDADSDWANVSMDEATDVTYAAAVGGLAAPAPWIPYDPLVGLFADPNGHAVDADVLDQGQFLLSIAIAWVAAAADTPEAVAAYEAEYPWATANQLGDVPGAPPCEGEVVARYWQALWDRLHDVPLASPILRTWPEDGAYGHPVAADSVDARVSIAFARGLDEASLGPEDFVVTAGSGAELPVAVDLFYRHASHVVHLIPSADWPSDAITVEIRPGIRTFDGEMLDGHTFAFDTRPPPEPPEPPEPDPEPSGCACDVGRQPVSAAWLLLAVGALRRRRP